MKRLALIIFAACALTAAVAAVADTPARADAPTRQTVAFDLVFHDYPGDPVPHCSFDVVADFQVADQIITFTDAQGTPVRVTQHITFVGVLRAPSTGKAVPDSGNVKFTDQLAPYGSAVETFHHEVHVDRYFHVAINVTTDASGNPIKLVGEYPSDITPLCVALS
jgi:hypothetical protein